MRINGAKSQNHHPAPLELAYTDMKRVPVAKYLSTRKKETNLHQSHIQQTSQVTGIFEPASAHHQFNKEHALIRHIYDSLNEDYKQQRYVPVAVSTGAERIVPFSDT